MSIINSIKCTDIYSKISGRLWQYYIDEPALSNNNVIINFSAGSNNSISFKFKQQITEQTKNNSTTYLEIMIQLK